jgi:hypothetical protein
MAGGMVTPIGTWKKRPAEYRRIGTLVPGVMNRFEGAVVALLDGRSPPSGLCGIPRPGILDAPRRSIVKVVRRKET